MTHITNLSIVFLIHFITAIAPQNVENAECKIREDVKKYVACSQCTNGYVMNCSNRRLKSVPSSFPLPHPKSKSPMCILDLRDNLIQNVSRNAFANATSIRCLYLSNNKLRFLEQDAFIGLDNLAYINLSNNALEWNGRHMSFAKGVFKPLKNLRDIDLKNNLITSYCKLDEELQYLSSLEKLFIDGCRYCKLEGKIKSLRKLRQMNFSGRTTKACNMGQLAKDVFESFSGIGVTQLFLSSCNISSIDKNALQPFNKSLVELDISYNEELTFSGMDDALGGLKYSVKLTTLNTNRIHTPWERGTILERHNVQNLQTLHNLTKLNMDLNKLEVINVDAFTPYSFPRSVQKVSLVGNRLTFGKYVSLLGNVSGLEELDISRQHVFSNPFNSYSEENDLVVERLDSECNCSSSHPYCKHKMITIPQGLKHVSWRESFIHARIPPVLVCNGEQLQTLDVSLNLITYLQGPVLGLHHVTFLDLSFNLCNHISSNFLDGFTSLKHLNLSSNELGRALNGNGSNVFRNVTSLESLDLSKNRILTLPRDMFVNLINLKYLNLSSNNIDKWDFDLWNSKCLNTLDLSHNLFELFPRDFELCLDGLSRNACKNRTKVHLILSYNPIACNCHTVPFLKWVLNSKVGIRFSKHDECHLHDGERFKLEFAETGIPRLVNQLKRDCVDYGWLIGTLTTVLICLTSTICTLIVYRKRWKLRHMYYSKRRRHVHHDYQRLYAHDAFVSYSKNLARFVKEKMVPALEDERGLQLWITDRNSHPGASIAENIVHAIYNSKKSIHLLDTNYLSDTWCDYEINMANMEAIESNRKCVIIVEMDVNTADIPISIMRLLDKEENLKFPARGNEEEVCAFWTHLAEIIMAE